MEHLRYTATWILTSDSNLDRGIVIELSSHLGPTEQEAEGVFRAIVQRYQLNWLKPPSLPWEKDWTIELEKMREWMPSNVQDLDNSLPYLNWLVGTERMKPSYDLVKSLRTNQLSIAYYRFPIYERKLVLESKNRIFLSHKGADKPLVRRVFNTLKILGFDPWLDEDAMTAGDSLHREILSGMKASCAAVFFITPNFKDESHLQNEIDYAIAEKTSRGDNFKIITLCLKDELGQFGKVPQLLEQYLYRSPEFELEILDEVLKALPIAVGQPVTWRSQPSYGASKPVEYVNGFSLPHGSRKLLQELHEGSDINLPIRDDDRHAIVTALKNQQLIGIFNDRGKSSVHLNPNGKALCEQLFGERQ